MKPLEWTTLWGQVICDDTTPAAQSTSSGRVLRPRKFVNYAEFPEPDNDAFIWCRTCKSQEYNGCEMHAPELSDGKEFNMKVETSFIANAGDRYSDILRRYSDILASP